MKSRLACGPSLRLRAVLVYGFLHGQLLFYCTFRPCRQCQLSGLMTITRLCAPDTRPLISNYTAGWRRFRHHKWLSEHCSCSPIIACSLQKSDHKWRQPKLVLLVREECTSFQRSFSDILTFMPQISDVKFRDSVMPENSINKRRPRP